MTMKTKITLAVFLFFTIVGVVSSTFLYIKLEKTNAELVKYKAMVDFDRIHNDTMERQMNKRRIRDSIPKSWAYKPNFNKNDPKSNQKERNIQARLNNAEFLVGVYAYGGTTDNFNKIVEHLDSIGYSTIAKVQLDAKPRWLAASSTVFYYDDTNQSIAQNLANEMGNVTHIKFDVQKGSGFGVPEGREKQYMYIHLIENRQ